VRVLNWLRDERPLLLAPLEQPALDQHLHRAVGGGGAHAEHLGGLQRALVGVAGPSLRRRTSAAIRSASSTMRGTLVRMREAIVASDLPAAASAGKRRRRAAAASDAAAVRRKMSRVVDHFDAGMAGRSPGASESLPLVIQSRLRRANSSRS
jgi:hypothetical protein